MIDSKVKESVSYLKGLIDGQNTKDEAQRKVLDAIVAALDAMADELVEHSDAIEDIDDTIVDIYEAIDEITDDDYDDDDDLDFFEVKCPHCHELVFFDHEMLDDDDELICPVCNERIDPFEDDDED